MSAPTKRRKLYLHNSQPFVVPATTKYRRSQQQRNTEDVNNGAGPSTISVISVQEAPPESSQCSAGGQTSLEDDADADNIRNQPEDDRNQPAGEDGNAEQFSGTSYDEAQLLSDSFAEFGASTLPNSTTTKVEAIAMIMAFVVSHNLPWTGLADLLELINSLFGSTVDVLPRSKYLFRKMWTSKVEELSTHHYYCEGCVSTLAVEGDHPDKLKCTSCSKVYRLSDVRSKNCFFTILSFRHQVKNIIEQTKDVLFKNLQKLQDTEADSETITDITDGTLHKRLKHAGVLRWSDLTFTFNTDGSPVFSSSHSSVWPIQFIINELPASCRFAHNTLAGLWFGPSHPNMALFLKKFVDDVKNVGEVTWEVNSMTISSRLYALCCCVDAPARAAVRNHVLFNGNFGCPWCLMKPEYVSGSMRYLGTSPYVERSEAGVVRDMELALQFDGPVNGIKGPSPVMNLPHFNLVWGFTVEYMHAVLLGVARQFTDLMFNSVNHGQAFYIGSPTDVVKVNKRLLSICPPHCFTRLPRQIKERAYWKASEWRHWLLYYSLPCTLNILPQRHWKHWCLLVEAIHLLLQEELHPTLLARASTLLQKFVFMVPSLYEERFVTFNVHQLLHLTATVQHLGPLWAHSAFVFEDGNGRLTKTVTAANGVALQIVERVVLHQQLKLLLNTQQLSARVREVCVDMLQDRYVQNYSRVDGAVLLGVPQHVCQFMPAEEEAFRKRYGRVPSSAKEFLRVVSNGQVHHSVKYTKAKKSNSTVISTKTDEYFSIQRILEVKHNEGDKCILLCKRFVLVHGEIQLPAHIKECFLPSHTEIFVVELFDVRQTCLYILFLSEHKSYLCDLANTIERD
ncbi:uncharacterized protein LOC135388223 [Ornithodoros turicata]|uniref:uncharacterized protein LOC135388223 n=1 Tax=Ornithodoros turicata TaxID=34597 RepID=UPI003138B254